MTNDQRLMGLNEGAIVKIYPEGGNYVVCGRLIQNPTIPFYNVLKVRASEFRPNLKHFV